MLEADESAVKHRRHAPRAFRDAKRSEPRLDAASVPSPRQGPLKKGREALSRPFTLGFNEQSQFQTFPCRKNAITSA
jgi:hypothetical protein